MIIVLNILRFFLVAVLSLVAAACRLFLFLSMTIVVLNLLQLFLMMLLSLLLSARLCHHLVDLGDLRLLMLMLFAVCLEGLVSVFAVMLNVDLLVLSVDPFLFLVCFLVGGNLFRF